MSEFLLETIKPPLFWTAFSAIATFCAVLVALFLPIFTNYRKYSNMKKVIYMEFYENCSILGKIGDWNESTTLNNDFIPTGYLKNMAYVNELNLSFWNKYKFEISIRDITIYNELKEYISDIEKIKLISKNEEQHVILQLFCHDFIESLRKSKFKNKL